MGWPVGSLRLICSSCIEIAIEPRVYGWTRFACRTVVALRAASSLVSLFHWPDLDEDVSVENLLSGARSGESQRSFKQWLESRAPAR